MNILLIGNGFDLAHGLPTKYKDFLKFVEIVIQIINAKNGNDLDNIDWKNIHIEIKRLIQENIGNTRNNLFEQQDKWKSLLADNIWIDYFLQCEMYQRENWIDFENEISKVIQSIDKDMDRLNFHNNIITLENKYLNDKFTNNVLEYLMGSEIEQKKIRKVPITYKQLRDRLNFDLNNLILALEIYLSDYVEQIDIKIVSPDIEGILSKSNRIGTATTFSYVVINFNYTHICERIYGRKLKNKDDKYNYDYIHGEVRNNREDKINNMVLGIDEYLPKDRRNEDIEFIAFKKYFQRIHKETGCEYKSWVYEITESGSSTKFSLQEKYPIQIPYEKFVEKYRVYIFGHSLDITDGDIIRTLILNDNVYTKIFYCNREVYAQQIANLVKIIGQEELIKRTSGNTKTIEFCLQQDMVAKK